MAPNIRVIQAYEDEIVEIRWSIPSGQAYDVYWEHCACPPLASRQAWEATRPPALRGAGEHWPHEPHASVVS